MLLQERADRLDQTESVAMRAIGVERMMTQHGLPASDGGPLQFALQPTQLRPPFVLGQARDAILVRNLEGVIVYANPSAATLYGWAENAFQNPGVVEQLFAPCSEMVAEATEATRRHGEWTGEMRQATRTGEIRVVRSRWTLIRDQRNAPQAILLINSDITHEKQLESQVLRTQRLEAVWSLAGGMAHDLSNSLAPVLMGIQRLQKRVTDPESQRTLSVIEANTQRGADMVRQVLAFSRGQDGHRELLALGRHLREMERIVAGSRGHG